MKNQHPLLSDDELRKMGQFVAALNKTPRILPKFADMFPPESVLKALSEAIKIDSKHLFDAASTMSLMADPMPPLPPVAALLPPASSPPALPVATTPAYTPRAPPPLRATTAAPPSPRPRASPTSTRRAAAPLA